MLDFVSRRAGPFTGEGQTWFPFGFLVYSPEDVAVSLASSADDVNPRVLTYGADYEVTVNEDQQATPGGSVSLLAPLKEGEVIAIVSSLKYTQETQLTNFSRFPPEVINDALDRTVILIQQLVEQASRALSLPATSTEDPQAAIEKILDTATKANEYAQKALQTFQAVKEVEREVSENAALVVASKESVDASHARVDSLAADVEANKEKLNVFNQNVDNLLFVVDNKTAIQAIAADLQGYPIDEFDGGWTDEADEPMNGVGGVLLDCAQNMEAIKSVAGVLESIEDLAALEDTVTEIGSTDYVKISDTGIVGA